MVNAIVHAVLGQLQATACNNNNNTAGGGASSSSFSSVAHLQSAHNSGQQSIKSSALLKPLHCLPIKCALSSRSPALPTKLCLLPCLPVNGKMRNCGMRNAESKMWNRKMWKWMRNGG